MLRSELLMQLGKKRSELHPSCPDKPFTRASREQTEFDEIGYFVNKDDVRRHNVKKFPLNLSKNVLRVCIVSIAGAKVFEHKLLVRPSNRSSARAGPAVLNSASKFPLSIWEVFILFRLLMQELPFQKFCLSLT